MGEPNEKLAILSEVERRLAGVQTVDEAKGIRDKAEALRVYAKSARAGLGIQNRAAAIKIFAEQKAGALLQLVERAPAGRKGANGNGIRSTLERIGIAPVVSHRWQTMARLPEADVRRLEAECNEAHAELTSAEIFRLAKGGAHVQHNTGESEWYTPEAIILAARRTLGEIDLDPATHEDAQAKIKAVRYFTAKDDGLTHAWEGRVWLNPPYSQPLVGRFCEKLIVELEAGHVSAAITLTNNATETEWGQLLLSRCLAACFPAGRVKFWAPGRREATPLQGQMVCYFGRSSKAFYEQFMDFGPILRAGA